MRNIEFKARINDPKALMAKARALGADLWGDLRQTDTYFAVARGRLKLRETAGLQGELIYYERDEQGSVRASDYDIARTPDPAALKAVLSRALGVKAVVAKKRTLLTLDATRIHLDNVDELGAFLELEVPVRAGEDEARQTIDTLLRELGFDWAGCIRASYLDLKLAAAAAGTRGG